MTKTLGFAIIAFFIFNSNVAEAQTATRKMTFSNCLKVIRKTATDLGVALINIVETNIVRIVRFVTKDGSVLVTCSAPDQKIIMTMSKRR